MKPRTLMLLLAIVGCASVAQLAPTMVDAATGDAGLATAAAPRPSERERQMALELGQLEQVWAEGGGTVGYPFWEKAGQNWAQRTITTTMYREYVTGYRDRLVAGCALLDAIRVDDDIADDVRTLVIDACDRRVAALRSQQRWLEVQIEREQTVKDPATADSVVDVEARIVELDEQWRTGMQKSFRSTRLAMNLAQESLDEAGLDRLREDAFM